MNVMLAWCTFPVVIISWQGPHKSPTNTPASLWFLQPSTRQRFIFWAKIVLLFAFLNHTNIAEANIAEARYQSYWHTHYDGRPSAWCGWQMRQWYGGGPELNLARNWARVGNRSRAQVGAIVVWPHHVGMITGWNGRHWIIKSGNDGNRIRERPRSVSGAIAFRTL